MLYMTYILTSTSTQRAQHRTASIEQDREDDDAMDTDNAMVSTGNILGGVSNGEVPNKDLHGDSDGESERSENEDEQRGGEAQQRKRGRTEDKCNDSIHEPSRKRNRIELPDPTVKSKQNPGGPKKPSNTATSAGGSKNRPPASSNDFEIVFLGYSRPKSIFADYYVSEFQSH
jgi:hypothetical protein